MVTAVKNTKKAQAAMEFLMTYGWVILVVIAAVIALSYTGVMKPNKYLPERCIFPIPLTCLDSSTSGNYTNPVFTLLVQDSAGFEARDVSVTLRGKTVGVQATCTEVTGLHFAESEIKPINFTCSGTAKGTFKGEIIINYTNANTGMSHETVGEIIKNLG
jgi:hypothetical protein